ncbi:bifunctional UDP-N-acetylmuramoyl-tripeptide:D-alanyl-D-alanine ligase/alanine racemase [Algivirga pacifica]|uniref:Alanine racemase n=1 Tax=Algivirga pacifica TaxID=1162670 RepID=A0ABP9D5N8_9BACT
MINFQQPFWQKTYLLTDSRSLISAAETLFFALRGMQHHGHQFIEELYQKGVRSFVVEPQFDTKIFPEATFYATASPLTVLQELVAFHRKQFDIPVIGITGSNGKTIIKEWLYTLLSGDRFVVKTPKSYNSQIGVPISVWQLSKQHEIGLFEAGISKGGEMERLEEIIRPTIGILTNIGSAHDEGFRDRRHKLQEKLKLFRRADTLVYCIDQEGMHEQVQRQLPVHRFTWSLEGEGDVNYVLSKEGMHTLVEVSFRHIHKVLQLPFTDGASLENALHCIAMMLLLEYTPDQIEERLTMLKGVDMRLGLKEGKMGCMLIDDTYNNDLAGLSVGLDYLQQHSGKLKRTVVLSDILQSGKDGAQLYREVAELIKGKKVERLVMVGDALSDKHELFKELDLQLFSSTESLLEHIRQGLLTFTREIILIKGARPFRFERVVQLLQRKAHGTRLEVSMEALVHNFNFYRSMLNPDTKVMVMVKALAYGSSRHEVGSLLEYHLVDYLGVAYVDEGVDLREHGVKVPIMVLNPASDAFDQVYDYHLEPEIYSLSLLRQMIEWWEQSDRKASELMRIQLNFDTGMHRLGFMEEELNTVLETLKQHSWIKVTGVFTHLAGADESIHNEYSATQIHTFQRMAKQLEEGLGYTVIKHCLNSAGISRFPEAQMDMVRLGIGLYGVDPTNRYQGILHPISTLKTIISQVKELPQGKTVGYSRKGELKQNSRIATISIGYADGFDRRFSNGVGKVMVRGKMVPVVGNVCMDMTMIDITGTDAREGDEVIIFGESLTIESLASSIGTIPYEILTNINERVKRVFYM